MEVVMSWPGSTGLAKRTASRLNRETSSRDLGQQSHEVNACMHSPAR